MKKQISKLIDSPAIKWLLALIDELNRKNITLLSAGMAYFAILAFFPLLVALVAFGTLFLTPENINEASDTISSILPSSMGEFVRTQMENAEGRHYDNVLTTIVAFGLSLLGISGLTGSMMNSLNVMYEKKEHRSFWRVYSTNIMLTLGLVVSMFLMIPLLFATDGILLKFGVSPELLSILSVGRWIVLPLWMMASLAVVYHIAPSHKKGERWMLISWGAITATIIWIVISAVFFWYLQNIANLTRSYSLFAGVIGMLLWFNVTSFVVLLGGELNFRLEKYTLASRK